jgi:hypothetical protein
VGFLLLLVGALSPALSRAEVPSGWETRRSDGLLIHHQPGNAALAAGLAREGPAIRRRLAEILGTGGTPAVEVVLIPAALDEGEERSVIPGAPEWAAGFTVPGSGVLFIRVRSLGVYPDRGLASVFAHELGHFELGRLAAPGRLPRWFEEGACMVLARPWDLRDSFSLSLAMLLRDPETLPDLEHHFPETTAAARSAYAQSFSFVSWLVKDGGEAAALGRVARRVGAGESFRSAFTAEFAMTPERALKVWRNSIGRWHRIVIALTGTTMLWTVMVLLVISVAIRKRRRSRAILERWEADEGRQDLSDRPIKPH